MQEFFNQHKWTVILAVSGLVLAVLLLTLGFWKTLLLLVLVALFTAVGMVLDRDGGAAAKETVRNLFHKEKDSEK